MSQHQFTILRANLSDQIADALENWILEEASVDGDKLPSEQTLAERFSVSRNVIRESLNILKARGLVENRNGSGNFVKKPSSTNVSEIMNLIVKMDQISVEELFDARLVLESAACRRAAVRITPEELEDLKCRMQKLEDRNLTLQERREMDLYFHRGIAKYSGNRFLFLLGRTMKNVMTENMFLEKEAEREYRIVKSLQAHQKIWDGLASGDPDLAEAAMIEHLQDSITHYVTALSNKN